MPKFQVKTRETLPQETEPNTLYLITVDAQANPPTFDFWYTTKENIPRRLSAQDVAALAADLSSLEDTVTALQSTVSALQDTVNGQASQISTLQNSVNGLDTRLTAAEQEIDQLQMGLSTAQNDISTLDQGLSTAQGDIVDLGQGLTSTNNSVQGIQTDLTAAENSISSISTDLSQAQTDIGSLNDSNTTLSQSLSSLDGEAVKKGEDAVLNGGLIKDSYEGSGYSISTVSSTLDNASNIVYGDSQGGAIVLDLPVEPTNKQRILIKKVTGDVNNVTVRAGGEVQADGVMGGEFILSQQGDRVELQYSTDRGWESIGGNVSVTASGG